MTENKRVADQKRTYNNIFQTFNTILVIYYKHTEALSAISDVPKQSLWEDFKRQDYAHMSPDRPKQEGRIEKKKTKFTPGW